MSSIRLASWIWGELQKEMVKRRSVAFEKWCEIIIPISYLILVHQSLFQTLSWVTLWWRQISYCKHCKQVVKNGPWSAIAINQYQKVIWNYEQKPNHHASCSLFTVTCHSLVNCTKPSSEWCAICQLCWIVKDLGKCGVVVTEWLGVLVGTIWKWSVAVWCSIYSWNSGGNNGAHHTIFHASRQLCQQRFPVCGSFFTGASEK